VGAERTARAAAEAAAFDDASVAARVKAVEALVTKATADERFSGIEKVSLISTRRPTYQLREMGDPQARPLST